MNNWKNFTVDNLPMGTNPFYLMYKDHLWKCEKINNNVYGVSPSGEIKLQTTIQKILDHDRENGDQTKWKR